MISGSFKNVIYKICLEIIYSIYMSKKDFYETNLLADTLWQDI